MNHPWFRAFAASALAIPMSCNNPSQPGGGDPNQKGNPPLSSLIGTFVFNGSSGPVQLRFANDSVLYEKAGSNPEKMESYRFRDSWLISWKTDPLSGRMVGVATGKVVFYENAFDLFQARIYVSVGSGLNANWAPGRGSGATDTLSILGDSLMVISEYSSSYSLPIYHDDNIIFKRGTKDTLYNYKLFQDTLLLFDSHDKIWRFNKT